MINVVVDLSHWNAVPGGFSIVKYAGVQGVIHKATQGTSYVDAKCVERKAEVTDLGMLWGAYHFGVYGDGLEQADFFLNTVSPGPDDLLVLDWEHSVGDRGDMSLIEAENWASVVHEASGRWPMIYSGQAFLTEHVKGFEDTPLKNCPLWIARYSRTHMPITPDPWITWTMWQYTDGVHGAPPHTVEGIGPCDRSKFAGNEQELRAFWKGAVDVVP